MLMEQPVGDDARQRVSGLMPVQYSQPVKQVAGGSVILH